MAKRDASPQISTPVDRTGYASLPSHTPSKEPGAAQPAGTRVFKKSSPNNKITAYLGKRDFVDQLTHTDPIDGVVLVDPEYITGKLKVYASVLAAFRYGREDLDVLGLTFRKDLYLAVAQIYPPIPESSKPLTRLQERLMKKLGHNAYPFNFELPIMAPASVILQPAPNDTGKPCGVDYELKCFVSESLEEKPLKKSTVRLAIRKVMYAPDDAGPQPHVEVSRDFMMSPGPLHMEVTLDKKKYLHGEPIAVNVQIANNSNKTVKKIKISVRQHADICLFSTAQYKCPVAELESDDGFPLGPCCNLSKVYCLTPLLNENRDKRGLALDGKLKHEDTNLASSTIFRDERIGKGSHLPQDESSTLHPENEAIANGHHHQHSDNKDAHRNKEKESLGIIVRYTVKVKLIVAFGQDVSAELGFILTHPKPELEEEPSAEPSTPVPKSEPVPRSGPDRTVPPKVGDGPTTPVGNLIELGDPTASPQNNGPKVTSYDNWGMADSAEHHKGEEDIIFEDFARLRLQGATGDLDESEPTPSTQHQ